jgi:hypothetical protein
VSTACVCCCTPRLIASVGADHDAYIWNPHVEELMMTLKVLPFLSAVPTDGLCTVCTVCTPAPLVCLRYPSCTLPGVTCYPSCTLPGVTYYPSCTLPGVTYYPLPATACSPRACVCRCQGHAFPLVSCQAVADSPELITADVSGMVRVWDVRTFQCVQSMVGAARP